MELAMTSYDQPPDQPAYSGQEMTEPGAYGGSAQPTEQLPPISEMSVSTPTLQWVSIGHPQEQIPIGPDDYVLSCEFNHNMDAWEVLIIVQPTEAEEDDDEES